jgi:hypothetical protein
MEKRLFNLFRMRNHYDAALGAKVDYRLKIVAADTRVHCTHYRGPVQTPVKLGMPDITSMSIGRVVFRQDHDADLEQKVRFDFQFRANPEPKFVVFFCRRNFATVTHQYKRTYHEGPAIKQLKIGLNTQINALRMDNDDQRCRFSQLTAQCFPEFVPPIDERATVFAFPYSQLNHGCFDSRAGSRMFGEATLEWKPYDTFQRYKYDDAFELRVMFIYDGRFLSLSKHGGHRSGITML